MLGENSLVVIEVDSRDGVLLSEIEDIVRTGMGSWHAYYAMTCLTHGLCKGLLLVEDNRPVGAALFYTIRLKPSHGLGIIYYLVVEAEHRGMGLGKVLVASAEYLMEDEDVIILIATTSVDNYPSRRLFSSLGYEEVPIESIEELYGELLTKLTCGYDDDILLVKSLKIGLPGLMKILRSEYNRRKVENIWYTLCYRPWIQMRKFHI